MSHDPTQLLKGVIKAIVEEKIDKVRNVSSDNQGGDPTCIEVEPSDTDEITKNVDALGQLIGGKAVGERVPKKKKKGKKKKPDEPHLQDTTMKRKQQK